MRFNLPRLLTVIAVCVPALAFAAKPKPCVPAGQAAQMFNKDVCVTAHVYDVVQLPNGTRFRLHADVTGTPGSRTRVVGEGTIKADSRLKKDGIEYGGAVGAGAITGAIVAGPAGALAGTLIGAGAITVHLLVSHPQATLDPGTTLMFMLTDPLYLAPDTANGN